MKDGDFYTAEVGGENVAPLIIGPEMDMWPTYSRIGTQLMFERDIPGEPAQLMLANADGSGVVPFAEIPGEFPWSDWGPDGIHYVAEWKIDGVLTLQVLTTDGSEPTRTLDLNEVEIYDLAGFRPPDGQEIVFSAHATADTDELGLYAIGVDGSGLRAIGEPANESSFGDMAMSPDGATIVYWNFEPGVGTDYNLYARDLTTGETRLLSLDPAYPGMGWSPHFSPDGTALLYETGQHTGTGGGQLAIAPFDGHDPALPLGTSYNADQTCDFSPDGTMVLQDRQPGGTWFIDPVSGAETQAAEYLSQASWQRLGL